MDMHSGLIFLLLFFVFFLSSGGVCLGQKKKKAPARAPPAGIEKGRLVYSPDERGNRVPDFSYSGYKGGDEAIPNLPVRVVVPWKKGDATVRIQAALDYVGGLSGGGAVLLEKGVYEVGGQ